MKLSISKILKLSNNVRIFLLNDKIQQFDIEIIFNNHGACYDKINKISGIQHLIEHIIASRNINLNLDSNAYTSFNHLNFGTNFNNLYDLYHFLKQIINKDHIDLKTNLESSKLSKFIKELDNEYKYRLESNCTNHIQNFIYTGRYFYSGGNNITFANLKKVKLALSQSQIIFNDDIIVFLKESKEKYLSKIINIFSKLKKRSNSFKIKKIDKSFYNQVIRSSNNFECLIFTFDIKDIDKTVLLMLKQIFPNFYFNITECCDLIFIQFFFENQIDMFSFIIYIKEKKYTQLKFANKKIFLDLDIDTIVSLYKFLDLQKMEENVTNLELKLYLKMKKDEFLHFFDMLEERITNKKYIINIKKDSFYNKVSDINEKYLIEKNQFDIFFYLLNYNPDFSHTNNNLNYLLKYVNSFPCFYNIFKKIDFNNNIYFDNKFTLFFFNDILNIYFITNIDNIDFLIKEYTNNKITINKDIDIKLQNKIYYIKTEYDFLYILLKLNYKFYNKLIISILNLQHKLKLNGYVYYFKNEILEFKDFFLFSIFTNSDSSNYIKIINIALNFIKSNNIKFETSFVISHKSLYRNFDNLKKKLVISI